MKKHLDETDSSEEEFFFSSKKLARPSLSSRKQIKTGGFFFSFLLLLSNFYLQTQIELQMTEMGLLILRNGQQRKMWMRLIPVILLRRKLLALLYLLESKLKLVSFYHFIV